MARSFLGGEFADGESAWWLGNWIPLHDAVKSTAWALELQGRHHFPNAIQVT